MPGIRSVLLLGATAFLVSACGEIREDLGLGRNVPDEFAVVEHPPLSMPPDFSLRPPRPGAPRPQAVDPSQRASEALFDAASAQTSSASAGEQALLAASGATKADASIRETVNREAAAKVAASPHLVERLLNGETEKPATTVDAAAEAERIKKAQENKEPLNATQTPVIEKKKSGWLGL